MLGRGPINLKCTSISTGALTANTIYRLRRSDDALVTPDYANDGIAVPSVERFGVAFQNRTVGDMYIWYGEVPTALQTPTTFAAAAFKLPAGEVLRLDVGVFGLCYVMFASPAAGYVMHVAH